MAEDRLKRWETLFRRALLLIDSAMASEAVLRHWSFGPALRAEEEPAVTLRS